jgi:hypothetical protein
MIPVPVLTPQLSSLWLKLVTPVHARVGRALIEGVRNPTVVAETTAQEVFDIQPCDINEAIHRAQCSEDIEFEEKKWSQQASPEDKQATLKGMKYKSRFVDTRSITVGRLPDDSFNTIRRVGGKHGWFFADWLWQIRGLIDLAVGGVGMRRGRRDAEEVEVGDIIDCWRVQVVKPSQKLRLYSEMKLPGRAWLQFEVEPSEKGSKITQTAIFDPVGVMGQLYWYVMYPAHEIVFAGMLRGIAEALEKRNVVDDNNAEPIDFPGHS